MPRNIAILIPETPRFGSVNVVLTARARRHSVRDFPGPLSIKTVVEGRVAWKTEGRQLWVDGSSFLVLNDGEPYSMEIDEHQPVTTCCVFFATGFVETVSRDIGQPGRHLLDEPASAGAPLTFLSRLHPQDERVIPAMRAIRKRVLAGAPATEMEERYLLLARDLLLVHEEMRRQIARVPAARAATRTETLRRLSIGREFLHAQAANPVTLQDAAGAAHLSPYHFHRSFTGAFGQTPHSYLTPSAPGTRSNIASQRPARYRSLWRNRIREPGLFQHALSQALRSPPQPIQQDSRSFRPANPLKYLHARTIPPIEDRRHHARRHRHGKVAVLLPRSPGSEADHAV